MIEKKLIELVKEMIEAGMIDGDKKKVKSNFDNARNYEIRQMLESIAEHYENYIKKGDL
jgi:hypothetical protein